MPQHHDEPRFVRHMLDLSTAHLPQELGSPDGGGLVGAEGVVAYRLPHGWLMWVPDDPDDSAVCDPPPPVVMTIQRLARRMGCDYVLFDPDAHIHPQLAAFDW